jgi:hypothetical protein
MTANASTKAHYARDIMHSTTQIIFERDVDSFLRDMVDDDDGLAW